MTLYGHPNNRKCYLEESFKELIKQNQITINNMKEEINFQQDDIVYHVLWGEGKVTGVLEVGSDLCSYVKFKELGANFYQNGKYLRNDLHPSLSHTPYTDIKDVQVSKVRFNVGDIVKVFSGYSGRTYVGFVQSISIDHIHISHTNKHRPDVSINFKYPNTTIELL
jgi:hypothetical protein